MNQKNKNRLNFALMMVVAAVFAVVTLFCIPENLLSEMTSGAYGMGSLVGMIASAIVWPIIGSLLIDAIVGYFTKNSRSWWLVWVVFSIISILIFLSNIK